MPAGEHDRPQGRREVWPRRRGLSPAGETWRRHGRTPGNDDGAVKLPGWLSHHPGHRLLICHEHETAVPPGSLLAHLHGGHGLRGAQKASLVRSIRAGLDLATPEQAGVPPDGGPAVPGIAVLDGFCCTLSGCEESRDRLSTCREKVIRHRNRMHNVRYASRETAVQPVRVQTFFKEKKHVRLFVVNRGSPAAGGAPGGTTLGTAVEAASASGPSFEQEYRACQESWEASFGALEEAQHPSQLSPWLRRTGFQEHLAGCDKGAVLRAVASPGRAGIGGPGPDKAGKHELTMLQEPMLVHVSQACFLLLEKAGKEARPYGKEARLSRRDARILNSLEAGRVNSQPFRPLQGRSSLEKYSAVWERLLCYVLRLADPDGTTLPASQITLTPRQGIGLEELRRRALDDAATGTIDGLRSDGQETALELAVLEASLALVEQPLKENVYQSPLLSYVAGRALKQDGSWLEPAGMTPLLSAIIHVVQLLLYKDVRRRADATGAAPPFDEQLEQRCARWLVNSSRGPMAELLSWRLYAGSVADSTVPPGWTSWSPDGGTVTHRDTTLGLDDWRSLLRHVLDEATALLSQELLFGINDPPRPRARDMTDVLTESRPSFSFVGDRRNNLGWQGAWLADQVRSDEALLARLASVSDGRIFWSSKAVAGYLGKVSEFLELLLLLVHMTGGLPGRAPEVLTLRHCNDETRRNVFIHNGQVMLLTGYHKTLYLTGSRLVGRFLPDAVGDLLVAYLAVALPFARYLQTVERRPVVRAWLFAVHADKPWDDGRLSRVMRRESGALLGQAINTSTWRHMAVAIDRRHLRGIGGKALELDEDEREEDVINDLQASHSTRTGNISYGNDIKHTNMLTDASLERYRDLSSRWHDLTGLAPRKRVRGSSSSDGLSRKRVAFRSKRRHHTDAELLATLRQIHGPAATPRSDEQWQALRLMAEEKAQLIVVMRTGGGKSLLFQLGSMLPDAGVTVVILPLVVLKQDLLSKCVQLDIPYGVWDTSIDIDAPCAPLVIVGVEDACTSNFHSFLRRLHVKGQLDRIVLDEAQMVLTEASYREALGQVCQVRRLAVPFVALSATLPPTRQLELERALFMDNPAVLRSSTDRPNIGYQVRVEPDVPLLDAACDVVREQEMEDESSRVICYVPSRNMADALAKKLSCQAYHAGIEDRSAVYRNWLEGRHKIIVGTSALGAGVDFPGVRTVLHVGAPRQAIAYSQESGRAGRDGRDAEAIVLLSSAVRPPLIGRALPDDSAAMQTFLSTSGCYRKVLTAYLDGGEGVECPDDKAVCHNCIKAAIEAERAEETMSESSSGTALSDELYVGDDLARQATRGHEMARRLYLERLDRSMSRCLLCIEGEDWTHPLCNDDGSVFTRSRAKLRLPPHIGCFSCVNPEWACDRQGASGECRWGEQTLWLTMAARVYKKRLPWAASACGDVLPGGYMGYEDVWQWAGQAATLFGEPAFNANVMADHILRLWADLGFV